MADPTVADFQAAFPELAAVTNIQFTLDTYITTLSRKNWGDCFNPAVLLRSAHGIALEQNRQAESTQSGGFSVTPGGRGALTSASAGGLSSSYTDPKQANDNSHDAWLKLTPYGQQYVSLRSQCLSSGGLIPANFNFFPFGVTGNIIC